MSDANRLLYLRIALVVIGLTAIFGFYPLSIVWPSGWAWGHGHSHYQLMIVGLYATLGVFLLIASRDPYANKSLIWFTVWSSLVHGAIMGIQAISDASERYRRRWQRDQLCSRLQQGAPLCRASARAIKKI
jgi:hypothetical protein